MLFATGEPAHAQDPHVVRALNLAAGKQYEDALSALDALDGRASAAYEVRFARARILAWAGEYDQAEQVYQDLLGDYPEDPDILIGYAQLAYYQQDFGAAKKRFARVAAAYPEYDDAIIGLERTNRALSSADADPKSRWRLDYAAELNTFERSSNDKWEYYTAQITRQRSGLSLWIKGEHYQRFGLRDSTVAIGAASKIGDNWDAALTIEGTPDADFRPEFAIDVEIGRTFFLSSDIPALRPYVRYNFDKYAEQPIHMISPGANAYLANGWVFDVRLITSAQRDESVEIGGMARLTAPVVQNIRVTLGAANAPEAIDGVVVRTVSVFGGVLLDISDKLSLRADYARDDRQNSFIRNVFSVNVTHRF